jgi:hypothetical protein
LSPGAPGGHNAALRALLPFDPHRSVPCLGEVYELPAAYRQMAEGGVLGKIVVRVG